MNDLKHKGLGPVIFNARFTVAMFALEENKNVHGRKRFYDT